MIRKRKLVEFIIRPNNSLHGDHNMPHAMVLMDAKA